MLIAGLRVVPHVLAREVRVVFEVERRGPPTRRRKRYCVKRIEINRPACWRAGDTLYMHPELIAKLLRQA